MCQKVGELSLLPLYMIKEELTDLLENYYNGSFVQMVCDYIHLTGMTKQEVENMLKPVRDKKGA